MALHLSQGMRNKIFAGLLIAGFLSTRARGQTTPSLSVGYTPAGVGVEVGQLGQASGSPLLEASPYASLWKTFESRPGSWVDYRLKLQQSVVALRARLFPSGDDDPILTRKAGDAAGFLDLVTGRDASPLNVQKNSAYDNALQTSALYFSSLLAQVGRAYPLFGPVDVAWSATAAAAAMKMPVDIPGHGSFLPKAGSDETVAARVHLPKQAAISVMGGVSQSASPLASEALTGIFTPQQRMELSFKSAPHAGARFEAPLPLASKIAVYGQTQWAPLTVDRIVGADLSADVRGRAVDFAVQYSGEKGDRIPFNHEQWRFEADAELSKIFSVTMGVKRERFQFGGENIDVHSAMVGLQGAINPGGGFTAKARVERRAYSGYTLTAPELGEFPADVKKEAEAIKGILEFYDGAYALLEAAEKDPSQAGTVLTDLNRRAIDDLTPEVRDLMAAQINKDASLNPIQKAVYLDILGVTPGPSPALNGYQVLALSGQLKGMFDPARVQFIRDHRDELRQGLDLLTDRRVMDRLAAATARHFTLERLQNIGAAFHLPAGQKLSLPIPVIFGIFQVYQGGLAPLSPITPEQSSELVDPWVMKQLGLKLNIPVENITPETVTESLLASLGPLEKQRLMDAYGERLPGVLSQAVADYSDTLTRELNAMTAQVLIAAEELNRLNADQGKKSGIWGDEGVSRSFRQLDGRR